MRTDSLAGPGYPYHLDEKEAPLVSDFEGLLKPYANDSTSCVAIKKHGARVKQISTLSSIALRGVRPVVINVKSPARTNVKNTMNQGHLRFVHSILKSPEFTLSSKHGDLQQLQSLQATRVEAPQVRVHQINRANFYVQDIAIDQYLPRQVSALPMWYKENESTTPLPAKTTWLSRNIIE